MIFALLSGIFKWSLFYPNNNKAMTHITVSQRKHLIDIFHLKKNKDDSPGCCCNLPAVTDLQGSKNGKCRKHGKSIDLLLFERSESAKLNYKVEVKHPVS